MLRPVLLGAAAMNFVDSVLRPGETVVYRGHLHWIICAPGILAVLAGAVLAAFAPTLHESGSILVWAGIALAILGAFLLFRAWFDQWITEIAVTNLRVIYKRGFIRRYTAEMSMTKVESVTINQSVLGRLLDYGTIHVRGVGVGMEHLHRIDSPIALRNAIVVH